MPLQNRVDPWGGLQAVSERGAWMGNRGCLHDAGKRLGASRWTRKQWVICKLEFNGRQRELMAPGKYTELFFLDEATALSAGHRPCNTCRRRGRRSTAISLTVRRAGIILPYAGLCYTPARHVTGGGDETVP